MVRVTLNKTRPLFCHDAVQADWGVPALYGCGAICMGLMVLMVWGYVRKFGVDPSLMKAGSKKKVRLSSDCSQPTKRTVEC